MAEKIEHGNEFSGSITKFQHGNLAVDFLLHPVFEELLHAFDTRPPVQRNEVE